MSIIMPAGGIIDPGIGFPHQSVEEKKATYDFFRPLLHDKQSLEEFEFPAEYMFKQVPDVVDPGVDPIEYVVAKMDAFGIQQAITGMSAKGIEAKRRHPGRFHLNMRADPNKGVDTVRAMFAAKKMGRGRIEDVAAFLVTLTDRYGERRPWVTQSKVRCP